MAKQRKMGGTPIAPNIRVPRGALTRIDIGRSFAEYDPLLTKPNVFVETPAIRAAMEPGRAKCFFIGRRGTGKTALAYILQSRFPKRTTTLLPQIFSELGKFFQLEHVKDSRQRHFKSLVCCFKRALADQVLDAWRKAGLFSFTHASSILTRERNFIEDLDFEFRLISFVEEIFKALDAGNDREWLKQVNRSKDIVTELNACREDSRWDHNVLIDRIDESWDGSDEAVILLSALMHACVELTASSECIRPMLFVRENIYERVRESDQEFARLETFVVSLDWSRELLRELIERRLNNSLVAKFPLHGPTWEAFFEATGGESSQDIVFNYCQYRPRDVLTYCSFAIESAQQRKAERIESCDLQTARKRFSDNRLKDLGDEYAENFPQIQLVFSRFYGLGQQFTLGGIDAFIKKLLVDDEIKSSCAKWIYRYTQPDLLIHLFYDLGFFGLKDGGPVRFRSTGAEGALAPLITANSIVVIHPSYADSLSLQDAIIGSLDPNVSLRTSGVILELPDAIDVTAYTVQLQKLKEQLQSLPEGDKTAGEYEELVGSVIRLCFFKALTNLEPRVRSYSGRVIRDWIASNTAGGGFWHMVCQRYGATQVIWECKNYSNLDAAAFHQAAYYMTKEIGRFAIVCFRGQVKKGYYEHIKRVSSEKDGGVILLLGDRDIEVFLRQAINMKSREAHLRDIFDRTVREIS